MKKMLLATALALPVQDVLNEKRLPVQNKPAAVAPKETITIISSFLELGRRKLSMQQNLWRRRKCC